MSLVSAGEPGRVLGVGAEVVEPAAGDQAQRVGVDGRRVVDRGRTAASVDAGDGGSRPARPGSVASASAACSPCRRPRRPASADRSDRRRRHGRRGTSAPSTPCRHRREPAWLATAAISSRICAADSSPRSAPSRRASSAASIQSSRAVPGGVILRATVLMRPSRLVVVPSVSVGPLAARTTSACCAEPVRKRSTAITVRGTGERRAWRGRCPGSRRAGRRRAARARRSCRRRPPAGCPVASRPALGGHLRPAAVLEPGAGRRRAWCGRGAGPGRGPCRGRRARCRGAARSGTAPRGGPRGSRRRRRPTPSADSARLARPSTTVTGPAARSAPAAAMASGSTPPTSWLAEPASSARTTSPAAPGRWRSVAVASSETEVRCGRQLDDLHAVAGDGVAQAQEEDRAAPPSGRARGAARCRRARRPRRWWRAGGRARPRRAARRRAGRRRGRCRARPWPAWPRRRRSRW